ncbi:uncharacterized protein LOC117148783 [Drosophila mauritiana]|uniref:Uncharacterized protein LOC117148783 n=1 Tax=Drosophila mauritiana TaxID=7226 RepID=A0A6P8KT77_DROMA|nr:uncharacterized protein LOC117148783 [Drosophila mauritiana]
MWMQLGCRGLAKSPRRKDDDSKPQSMIASAYRDEYMYNTYLAKNTFQLPAGKDSVYLANPSMNELMRAIQSGSSFKRVVVSMIVPLPRTFQLLAPANSPRHQNVRHTPNVVHRRHSVDHQLHQQRVGMSSVQRLPRVHSQGDLLQPRLSVCDEMISRDDPPVRVAPLETPTKPQELATEEPSAQWTRAPNKNACYWIGLAHLLLVISCLRGLF